MLLIVISAFSYQYIPIWLQWVEIQFNSPYQLEDESFGFICEERYIRAYLDDKPRYFISYLDGAESDEEISAYCRTSLTYYLQGIPAGAYWYAFGVLLFAIYFLINEFFREINLRYKEDDLRRKENHLTEKEKELEISIKNIHSSIQNMPPIEVIKEVNECFRWMEQYDHKIAKEKEKLQRDTISNEDRKEIVKSIENTSLIYIRDCLSIISKISKISKFLHNASNGSRFAANIMLIKEAREVIEDPSLALHMLHFSNYNNEKDVEKNESRFLILEPNLSSATDTGKAMRDQFIQNEIILLPVSTSRINLIPGAPSALVNGNDVIADCQSAFDGAAYPGISHKAKNALNVYFNGAQGKHIRSSLSIRIEDGSGDKISGVLNIHSDLNQIFTNIDRKEVFIQLIYPILLKLHKLIDKS